MIEYYIDAAFFNWSAYVFLALIVLGIPTEEWAVYSFSFVFLIFTAIMIAEPLMLLWHFGFIKVAYFFVLRWVVIGWRRLSRLATTVFDFALGKICLGLLVIHTVVSSIVWAKYNLDLPELFKATANLIATIYRNVKDYKLLAEAIQRWLHAIFMDYFVSFLRWVWDAEVHYLRHKPFVGVFYSLVVTAILVGACLAVIPLGDRTYKAIFEPIRVRKVPPRVNRPVSPRRGG